MESLIYFLLFAGAFFLMMRFGCGAHVMGHGHGHGESSSGRAESAASCREKFEANPTAFAKPAETTSQGKEHAHGTHH